MTPRRAARAAAQPLALDEAVAWLARAAPVPPELVAALAGKHVTGLGWKYRHMGLPRR